MREVMEAGRAVTLVSGTVRARGKTRLGKRPMRDNLGPLGLRCTQTIHGKQGFRAWKRDQRLEVLHLRASSSWEKKRSHKQE